MDEFKTIEAAFNIYLKSKKMWLEEGKDEREARTIALRELAMTTADPYMFDECEDYLTEEQFEQARLNVTAKNEVIKLLEKYF